MARPAVLTQIRCASGNVGPDGGISSSSFSFTSDFWFAIDYELIVELLALNTTPILDQLCDCNILVKILKRRMLKPGVNFINVLQAAFKCIA